MSYAAGVVVVMDDVAPLGDHHGGNRQAGSVVIPVPLTGAPDELKENDPQGQEKHQENHRGKYTCHLTVLPPLPKGR